jgi:hypothetical protein
MRYREYSIFYSWQSDAERETNWGFIQSALELAIAEIKVRNGFDSPILDWGLERVAGSPEVATIMFEKIRASAIFVGDVSLVGEIKQTGGKPTKKTANPNVLMEMAYAGAKIGWQRIICVMNTRFGKAEKLPVDIRNRRYPIRYKLSADDMTMIEEVKKALANDLRKAIDVVPYRDHQAVLDAAARFDSNCIRVVSASRFHPCFHPPPPNQVTFGSATGIDTLALNAAIPRLLDLGLIHCDFDSRQNLFSYHWTWLGRMFIRQHWPNDIPAWIAEIDKQTPDVWQAKGEGQDVPI